MENEFQHKTMSYNQLRKQGNNKPPFAELSIVTQETKEAISSKKKKTTFVCNRPPNALQERVEVPIQ